MRFQIVLILFAALLILPVVGIGSAQAQIDETVRANIPFDFYAANQEMAPGTYDVSIDFANNLVTIRDEATRHESFLMGLTTSEGSGDKLGLVFDRVGDSYFLRDLKAEDAEVSFPVQKAEIRLARNNSPTEVLVALNHL